MGLVSSRVSKAESSPRGCSEEDRLGCAPTGRGCLQGSCPYTPRKYFPTLCRDHSSTGRAQEEVIPAGKILPRDRGSSPGSLLSLFCDLPSQPPPPHPFSSPFSFRGSAPTSCGLVPPSEVCGRKRNEVQSGRGCLQVKPPACCWANERGDSRAQRIPHCPAVSGRQQNPAALHPRSHSHLPHTSHTAGSSETAAPPCPSSPGLQKGRAQS